MDNGFSTFVSLYFKIWTQPRVILRHILDNQPGYHVWTFVVFYAVFQAFLPIFYSPFAGRMTLDMLLLIGILISLVIDMGAFYYFSGLGYLLGRLLGGKGTFRDLQTAYAWSYPPACIAIIVLQVSQIPTWLRMMAGETNTMALLTVPQMAWQGSGRVLSLLLNLWTLVLLVVNVSEAHKISKWRSFGLMVLLLIPITLVGIAGTLLLVFSGLIQH